MLNFFRAGQDVVRWDLEVVQSDPYKVRLTMDHGQGSIVEYFPSDEAALARQRKLEELIVAARGFATAAPVRTPAPVPSSSQSKPLANRGTLLIVDDDLAVTQTFARMLSLDGYAVRTANSAQGGLKEADTANVDAVILDLRMPIADGLSFLREFRSRERHQCTPVVIVTGDYFLDDGLAEQLKQLNAEIRFKPLWLEDLVDLAKVLLTSRREVTPLAS
jgi:CheY-like chemotaxis protein